ncbi:hypothetical protein DCD74_08440 [Lysobacter oculi]|uniref:Transport permease protein n=2 Tax=Solilutibacter oculi TaxID=2698682 RepID=A0A344J6Q2_9GAMM|nr:hypothetical protein DCD74_08440 [Lysobacter oculi]
MMSSNRNMGLGNGLKLAMSMMSRDLRNRYATSYAGLFWHLAVPLINALVFVVVFSVLMRGQMGDRYGDVPFALFYFAPFSLWMFFQEVVARSTGVLREHAFLINKIAFPSWILPLVPLGAAFLGQFIVLLVVAGLMLANGVSPGLSGVAIFFLLWLATVVFAVGVAYLVGALSAYVPDLEQVVPITLNITFWLTPILYPATLVMNEAPQWVKTLILHLNPFTHMAESVRFALFGRPVEWNSVAIYCGVAVLALAIGVPVFRRLNRGFADVL